MTTQEENLADFELAVSQLGAMLRLFENVQFKIECAIETGNEEFLEDALKLIKRIREPSLKIRDES